MAEEVFGDRTTDGTKILKQDVEMTDEPNSAIALRSVQLIGADAAPETVTVEDVGECHVGHTALSSYCCIVLIIFAFLFLLIGSVLIFATTRYSDVEVVQFLSKHKYLKYASPLMFSLGLLMLISGGVFWMVRRYKRNKQEQRLQSMPTSTITTYCCSDTADPGLSSPNSLTAPRSRNSLGYDALSSSTSQRSRLPSASEAENKEWKWATLETCAPPPLGSFPQLSTDSPSLSPDHGYPTIDQCLVHQSCSTISSGSNEPSGVLLVECEPAHEVVEQ